MEVFNFMPYTYYTRMTVSGGKSRNAAAIGGYIILIAASGGDTTTLGPKGPVKL